MRYVIPKIAGLALLLFLITAFQLPHGGDKASSGESKPEQGGQCHMKNNTFKDGETITYKLYYHLAPMWLAAGEVTFKVEEIGNQYHLSAEGTTYSFYEWFFKVRDYYDSYVDKNTLLPSLSIRKIQEGKYTLYDKIYFDQEGRKAISDRGRTIESTKRKEYELENCMHDMLSIIYYSRNLDFESYQPGHKFPVTIFMDEKSWPLKVEYMGKDERKKIKGQGRFKTIEFSPEVIEGYVFKKDTRMKVWVSDDKNRIPLLIESPVSVGKVKAVLEDYKGLKYDLSSKLD